MIQLPAVWLSLGFSARSLRFRAPLQCSDAERIRRLPVTKLSSGVAGALSLLVAFVGAMTVQFIGGARLLETAAGI
ncbi:sodium:solute symporter family transporter [Shigella flexneri]